MCWHASFYFLCVYTVILMWKPFYFIFIDFVYKLRNGSFYHDCCKFAEIFFFMFVFMCIFPWCVLFEAWRRLHVYNACLSWFFIMLLYGICSFSLSDVARHICPVFVILFKIYKYILYPMLSYRFIADTAIFLQYYKLYAFCSVQKRKIFYKSFLWQAPMQCWSSAW